MSKTQKLSRIHLSEVSLVDFPANPGAKVTLFKRGQHVRTETPQMTDKMTPDQMSRKDLLKSMGFEDELAQLLASLEKGQDVAKGLTDLQKNAASKANASVTKALEAAGIVVKFAEDGAAVVEKAAEPVDTDYIDFEGERLLKSAVPAPVLASLEKSNLRVAALEKAARVTDLTKRGADTLPALAGTDLAKGMLLEAVEKMDAEHKDALLKSLKAADAAVSELALEKGVISGPDEGSASVKLNKLASEYAAKNSMSVEKAYVEVTKAGEGLALYKAARQETATQ